MTIRNHDALWARTQAGPALLASRERSTQETFFPALPAGSPLAPRHETVALKPQGHVYSYTIIHPSPKSGEAPYALACVDLDGPVRIFGRFRGGARPAIGDGCAVVPDALLGYAFILTGAPQ